MPDVSRSTDASPMAGFDDNPIPEPGPNDVTAARAQMLANHAIYVQGGASDPEREAERARKQLAASPDSIDWKRMEVEVETAMWERMRRLSAEVAVEEAKQEARRTAATEPAAEPVEPSGEVDTNLVRRYKELRLAEKAADAEKAAIKDEADKLEGQLIEMFTDAGVPSISLDGKTIFLHRSTFAQRLPGIDADDVKAALRAAGAGDLIGETVNANTLSAYVRELCDEDGGPGLPEPLREVLELGERFAVRVVDAGKRGRTSTKK